MRTWLTGAPPDDAPGSSSEWEMSESVVLPLAETWDMIAPFGETGNYLSRLHKVFYAMELMRGKR